MFDTESDSVLNISRTLALSPSEATEIRRKIIEAFPDLRSASQAARPTRR